jgi:hypothetical protein
METLETFPIPTPCEAPLPVVVRIAPWVDPVVDRRGHDPRSRYVERFWLGTLGPTATWLVRRLAAGFDDQPDGYDLDLVATAQALGLSYSRGTSSAFSKAFGRCIMFGLAHQRSDGYVVRRMLPDVARRHLSRLPSGVQREHERWLEASRSHRLEVLQRARALAAAMIDAGDDAELIETQLVAVGVPATTAAEAVELVVRNPTLQCAKGPQADQSAPQGERS